MITFAGMSHHTASLDTRARLSIAPDAMPDTLRRAQEELGPVALLATCNRLEIYVSGEHPRDRVLGFLERELGAGEGEIERHFRLRTGADAVSHLYGVASGIDSMVIGESEILGQVRDAFSASVNAGIDDALLSRLFHTAIRVGRRARGETGIGRRALSVSSIAAQQARALCDDLTAATVLVIGAGEAGRLAAASLVDYGAGDVVVVNRTPSRARALAEELGGRAAPLSTLTEQLARCDVAIACTGSPDALVDAEAVRGAVERREGAPLLIIDIAVPRDFDAAVRSMPGVHYLDMDDLQQIAAGNRHERESEVASVRVIIDDATREFAEWWQQLRVVPTISALTERAEQVRQEQLAKTLRRLHVTGSEREQLEALTRALVKQLLHDPISTLRERGDRAAYVEAARTLFRLDEIADAEPCERFEFEDA